MWFRVDDKLPAHRKARKVWQGHPTKRRDAAPFGLWVLAGAFSDNGFVPTSVLEDWDDDATALADRLVAAGLWEPAEQDGEQGYRFHDWEALNPKDASVSGIYGNHMRWHVGANKPKPDCPICQAEGLVASGVNRPDIAPDHRGDHRGDVGGESPNPTRPDPTRPEPDPKVNSTADAVEDANKPPTTKRARQLPADWQPQPATVDAIRRELPNLDLAREHAKFVDHFTANGKPLKDWDAAWRNWMRRATEYARPSRPSRQQETDDLFAAAARRMGVAAPAVHPDVIEGAIA